MDSRRIVYVVEHGREQIAALTDKDAWDIFTGYGNHSCGCCLGNFRCPISKQNNTPNMCSFYWPPEVPGWLPTEYHWKMLEQIKQERIADGVPVRGW